MTRDLGQQRQSNDDDASVNRPTAEEGRSSPPYGIARPGILLRPSLGWFGREASDRHAQSTCSNCPDRPLWNEALECPFS